MSSVMDATKTIYLIVHGRKQLLEQVKEKLALKGFEKEKMQNACIYEEREECQAAERLYCSHMLRYCNQEA